MEHTSGLRRLAVLLLNIVLFAASATAMSQARTAVDLVQFNIAAQPMKNALKALAKQSNVQIIFTPVAVKELKTDGVTGQMTTDEALDVLLKDTGLEFEREGDVVVVRDPKAKPLAMSPSSLPTVDHASLTAGQRDGVVRLAQASEGHPQNTQNGRPTSPNTNKAGRQEQSADLGEILVTGSLIRGAGSAGAPVIEITRDEIESSGLPTVSEVLHNLPQNFGYGANEGTAAAGGQSAAASANIGFGTSVNLRGLGTDSTLVLLNGRRLSAGGFANDFVDLSTIPLTIVERIEVLTDGASAIYGADAVAGVVNIILRDDFDGAETSARLGSSTAGDAEEIQAGQVWGTAWQTGNLVVAYEYLNRNNLPSQERDYAADSDLTRFGGNDFSSDASNPGNITDFSQNFAIPSGQDGTALSVDDLLAGVTNRQNTREGTDLLPEQRRHGAFLNVAQDITERLTATADVRYGYREFESNFPARTDFLAVPETNPFYVNPFGGPGPVFVNYSFIDDLGPIVSTGEVESYNGAAGLRFDIGESWQADAQGLYSADTTDMRSGTVNRTALAAALADTDPATAFNPFGDGSNTNPATLDSIKDFNNQITDASVSMVHATADGKLFALRSGDVKVAIGAEYREESFELTDLEGSVQISSNRGDRDVLAGFAELFIPLVSARNARRAARRLEISIAGRYEDHSNFGSTSDPKFGLLWSPSDAISIRATAGTSFKAPLLSQLQVRKNIILFPLPDPASPTGSTNSLILLGTRDDLVPEEATTYTAGVELLPRRVSGLKVEVNYFNIDIDGRIRLPTTSVFNLLGNDAFSSIVTRNPSVAEVDALFNDPGFIGTPIPPDQVGAIVDDRVSNIAVTKVSGIDLLLSYVHANRVGTFGLRFNGSYQLEHKVAVTGSAPLVDLVSTIGNPVDLRAQAGISWERNGFGASTTINYVDDYIDTDSEPDRRVDSWTTADIRLGYSTGDRFVGELFDDVTVSLTIQNVFDEDPPFSNIAIGVGYDTVNADALGRFAALQVVKRW